MARRAIEQRASTEGLRFVGLDESTKMIDIARARDDSIEWALGDMRRPPVSGTFDLIFCCFNTLQWCITDADLLEVFRWVRMHLNAGGTFAFDIYQPNVEYLSVPKRNRLVRSMLDAEGRTLEIREDADYDSASKVYTLHWRLQEANSPESEPLARMHCPLRHFFADDVERLLSQAGLAIHDRFGGLDRSTFSTSSKKQVVVCGPA
jgi:SAM-dependent methyltransferase